MRTQRPRTPTGMPEFMSRANTDRVAIEYLRRKVTEQALGFTSARQLKDVALLVLDRWEQSLPKEDDDGRREG